MATVWHTKWLVRNGPKGPYAADHKRRACALYVLDTRSQIPIIEFV